MSVTKKQLCEDVQVSIRGRQISQGQDMELIDIEVAVEKAINRLLKVYHYNETLPGGEMQPNSCIAIYDNVAVTQYKTNFAILTLPAMPVKLPKNMGVFRIGKVDEPFLSFIQVPQGMMELIGGEPIISDLMGQIAYEVKVPKVIFKTNIVAAGITAVTVELVIMDIASYTDYEPLPIPADMELDVVNLAIELLVPRMPADTKDDVMSEKSGGSK